MLPGMHTLELARGSRCATLFLLSLFGLVPACGGSGGHQVLTDNGQTGSIGAAECQVDADCQREADGIVAQLVSEGSDAAVRSATCVDGVLCDTVLRNDGKCFVDSPYGLAYDCTQSDEDILKAEAARRADLATCGGKGCAEAPKPMYHQRDPGEWDGMPVSLQGPPCEESQYCGLALACVSQMCVACSADADCAAGEGCVVDHCLKNELISCHSFRDCPGALCILSGFTGGTARGNEDMTSYCQ
ncbi:MAG: hypothetical protein ABIQ16_05975 [Polyangiaceae bacterium]